MVQLPLLHGTSSRVFFFPQRQQSAATKHGKRMSTRVCLKWSVQVERALAESPVMLKKNPHTTRLERRQVSEAVTSARSPGTGTPRAPPARPLGDVLVTSLVPLSRAQLTAPPVRRTHRWIFEGREGERGEKHTHTYTQKENFSLFSQMFPSSELADWNRWWSRSTTFSRPVRSFLPLPGSVTCGGSRGEGLQQRAEARRRRRSNSAAPGGSWLY